MSKVGPLGKAILILGVPTALFFTIKYGVSKMPRSAAKSQMLGAIDLPTAPANAASTVKAGVLPSDSPVSVAGPQIRLQHWAWNTHMGMWYAAGGKAPTSGSLFSKYQVNFKAERQDDVAQMQASLIKFADAYKKDANTSEGFNTVTIMGDGAAAFLEGVNPQLAKLGTKAVVVGSMGKSFGEDKFMGPVEWRSNPQSARGSLVSAYLRDGDWNIAVKWAFDNGIPVNPDEKTYDPNAMNFYNPTDYIEAAKKYVEGYSEERDVVVKGVRTGQKKRVTLNGVATWTPGDVIVAEGKGGLVNIASTKEFASQMPNVVIMIDSFAKANRPLVKNFLRASLEGGDQVKSFSAALNHAGGVSAKAYGEKDGAYWVSYFKGTTKQDKQGLMVELGGSKVHNLADNVALFGINGGTNTFEIVYNVFGNICSKLYPKLMPKFPKADDIQDLSYLTELANEAPASSLASADTQTYTGKAIVQKVAERAYTIEFASGSAVLNARATAVLTEIAQNAIVASGLSLQVIGHTDNAGNADGNRALSAARANSVKVWLQGHYASSFPSNRVATEGRGQDEPVADNTTAEGKARNRRVVLIMGK